MTPLGLSRKLNVRPLISWILITGCNTPCVIFILDACPYTRTRSRRAHGSSPVAHIPMLTTMQRPVFQYHHIHFLKNPKMLCLFLTRFLPKPMASVDLVWAVSAVLNRRLEGVVDLIEGRPTRKRSVKAGALGFLLLRLLWRLNARNIPSSSDDCLSSCSISCRAVTPFVARFSSDTASNRRTPRFGGI
jgi:hypothetical protein